MELLTSRKVTLPRIFFITDTKEIEKIPIGVPYIFGDESIRKYIIRIMEYEVLYKAAMASGFPFNFRKILKAKGYKDLKDYGYQITAYMNCSKTTADLEALKNNNYELPESSKMTGSVDDLRNYIEDSTVYVDIQKLKDLKIFPTWVEKIEEAVSTNIHNFATFNPNMYNKKLGGMYGNIELNSPKKNLIVIDISASIPKGVGTTCLVMSKNLAETFYADIIITGRESILFEYERLHELDVKEAYTKYGNSNEAKMFRKIVTSDTRNYKTAIVFGDYHTPCDWWDDSGRITREDAKKVCTYNIDKLISFHTTSNVDTAGYADFFSPNETEVIKDWVKYL